MCTLYILFWSLSFNAFNGSLFKTTPSPIFSLALCLCLCFFVAVALFHLDLVDLGYRLLGKMFICIFFFVVVVLYFKLRQLIAELGWSSFWVLCVKVDYLLPKYLVDVYRCRSFWVFLIYLVICLFVFFYFFTFLCVWCVLLRFDKCLGFCSSKSCNACCLWFLFCDLGWLEFWGILDFDLGAKCLVSREFEVSKFKTTVNEVWIFVDILICGQS